MATNAINTIYKIMFLCHGKMYEIYAKYVASDLEMYGFIEVGDLIFNSNSGILVDPSEEKLKTEFSGVKKTFIPMHAIFRIDEVDKEGISKISDVAGNGVSSNIHQFPVSSFTPDGAGRR
jgi:hypothetical protein